METFDVFLNPCSGSCSNLIKIAAFIILWRLFVPYIDLWFHFVEISNMIINLGYEICLLSVRSLISSEI